MDENTAMSAMKDFVMQHNAIHYLATVFCVIMLSGCTETQDPADDATGVSTLSTTTPHEPAFDLTRIREDYGDQPLTVLDISERTHNNRNALAVTFSVPINPADNIQRYLNVSKKSSGVVDGSWVLSDSGKIAWFDHIEPKTRYDITVHTGLTAANEQSLKQTQNSTLTTRDLKPSINFSTNGAFLTKGIGKGLPITAVNINHIAIDFFRVKPEKVLTFLERAESLNNYSWRIDEITPLTDLAYSGHFDIGGEKNTKAERTIAIDTISELQQPGLYLAVMQKAGSYDQHQTLWFSVTDIGIHARAYKKQLDVYTSSLLTGKALPDLTVTLLDHRNNPISESTTTPDGLASFALSDHKAAAIIASDGHSYSLVNINKPALDLSQFDLGKRPQLPSELFIYTPRDLFRPGETIDINGLLRTGDGKKTLPAVLMVTIKRPDGSEATAFKWQPQAQSYYYRNWQIPADAPLGQWSIDVTGPLEQPVSYAFKVEDFLPERMKLTFNSGASKTPLVKRPQKNLSIPVLGEYLYGAPAAGNRLSSTVNISQWRHPVTTLPDYTFGHITETTHNQRFDIDDITLDKTGAGTLKVPSRWQSTQSPLRVKLTSSLYESGGRPVTRAYSTLIWPHTAMVGIRPHFDQEQNPKANSRVSFDIIKATLDGTLHAENELSVKLIKEDREYFWVYDDNEGWHYEWTEKEFSELDQTVNVSASEPTTISFPVSWGYYRLQVKDPSTKAITSIRFYAGHNWYSDWKDSQKGAEAAKPERVTMALNKASYRQGDTAKVTIVPPQAGEALVMVEGDKPLWMQRLHIPADGITLDIPIDKTWQQHNLYVTAMVVRPGDAKAVITPKRSFGLIHLPLDRSQRRLSIDFEIPETTLPETQLNVPITISSVKGPLPESIKLTLAAVDVGVLSISDFTTPDPFEAFFGQRRYGIDSYDMYNNVIEASSAANARLRFGGDVDITRGGKKPRAEVQIVSLFSGVVDVNSDGQATIALNIPDFNGRLRLMAVAFSDNEFGSDEQEITVAAPIVAQLAMPRFLAMEDTATFALDLTNLSGETQTIIADFHHQKTPITPIVVNNHKVHSVTLNNGEKTTLLYNVSSQNYTGLAQFSLTVSGDNIETIERQWSLGVRPAYPAIVNQTYAQLDKGEQFSVNNNTIQSLLPDTIEATFSIANHANMNIASQLRHLLRYPYGCLEQTSSRVFPLLYATPKYQQQFQLQAITEKDRLQRITTGIDRIAGMQLSNGGYGLWGKQSPEEHWLSAYVGDMLVSAKQAGMDVPQSMYNKTMKRLTQYVNHSGRMVKERWSNNRNHYNFSYKAYASYVLARVNQAPLGSLRNLYDNHSKQAKTGLSQLHLGIALYKMGDQKRGIEAINKALTYNTNDRVYYGDYGSDIRDYSMMIHLLISNNIKAPQAMGLSFPLANKIRARNWLSTQERNALFLAGIAVESNAGKHWQAELTLGDDKTLLNQPNTYKHRLTEQDFIKGLTLTSTNEHPLFVSATTSGYSIEPPPVTNNGLAINRTWYTKDGERFTPSRINVGDLFLVHLEVQADQRTPDGLIVDLLPAGFELENQNLKHSNQLEDFMIEGKSIRDITARANIKYQEYRDDRFIAAVDINAYNSTHIVYLVRAVTPGTYRVPSPLVEDMYRPEIRGIGDTIKKITIHNKTVAQ